MGGKDMGGKDVGVDPALVASRVAEVREEIARSGRGEVALIAVTKSFGVDAIVAAHAAGCDGIGENYAQELLSKADRIPDDLPVHFIGRLQANKVRSLIGIVSVWETVDRASLVSELARRCLQRPVKVLLQVNTTGEESKGGCAPGDLDALLEGAVAAGLGVEGLMTVGPTGATETECRSAFSLLRRLADERGLRHCSMGMSQDWTIALSEGATILRLGSALFGPRTP